MTRNALLTAALALAVAAGPAPENAYFFFTSGDSDDRGGTVWAFRYKTPKK
jgi:hypothetical protein